MPICPETHGTIMAFAGPLSSSACCRMPVLPRLPAAQGKTLLVHRQQHHVTCCSLVAEDETRTSCTETSFRLGMRKACWNCTLPSPENRYVTALSPGIKSSTAALHRVRTGCQNSNEG